jgi:3-oxoacyl-[acyl-carrier-protein] synthase II
MSSLPIITGFGSVTPFGPVAGLLTELSITPEPITAWQTEGVRRAYSIKPFNAVAFVPGAKTRRMDSLSAWTLVAATLALHDAGIELEKIDRSRVAIVSATNLGCMELTSAFYQSAHKNGWAGTDPITFPETLTNTPAAHVALFHGLRGPNVTLSSSGFAAQHALLTATSLLRRGQADMVVLLSGDSMSRAQYAWYEAAGILSSACYSTESPENPTGFIPSEGVVAAVLEKSSATKSYARLECGVSAAQESGSLSHDAATIFPVHPVARGMADSGGLFQLLAMLSQRPAAGTKLELETGAHGFKCAFEVVGL